MSSSLSYSARPVSRGPHLVQVAQVATQLSDGLDLLVQEVALQAVAQLGVTLLHGQVVQLQQAVADTLLQVTGPLRGLEPTLPVFTLWFPDVRKADEATAQVLQHYRLPGLLPLLVPLAPEAAAERLRGHMVPV